MRSAAAAAAAAGCLGEPEDAEEGNEAGLAAETDSVENGSPDGSIVPPDWESVAEIRLETNIAFWIGVDPDPIAEAENPMLVLFEGREYAITWENADDFRHNLELRDANDEIVDGYATPTTETEGETQTLEFEASPAIAEYVCAPHEASMRGDVEVLEA